MKKALFLIAALTLLSGNAFATSAAPLSGGDVTMISVSVGTSSSQVLAYNGARQFLQVQDASDTANVSCTFDGSTPVINGNGIQLSSLGAVTYDVFVPRGAVKCIADKASTPISIVHR